jgi:hypothetical protein
VLYACVRCQAFDNSLSADMLVGQRELLARAGPRTRPKEDRQLGLGLTYNPAGAAPSNNQRPRQITKRAAIPLRRARSGGEQPWTREAARRNGRYEADSRYPHMASFERILSDRRCGRGFGIVWQVTLRESNGLGLRAAAGHGFGRVR